MNVVFHFIAKKYPFIYYFFTTACPMSKKKKKIKAISHIE